MMKGIYNSTGCSVMLEDDTLLQQTDWDYLLSNKAKFDNWKELDHKTSKHMQAKRKMKH